ncbi:TerC family protein [Sporolactobacillus nakayamae]|uniref:Integral membrane protein, YjbE family n=1 Tax=Sporolactobacillus nakayamae TaxID=269670 RepID=A0A1I2VQC2_9BACL|nr:TerC family protein [Sporolactobacillus nakayamae]SFG91514.1 integral membrane protein, YjbE family [Sporolactobacillus nakayamae]
MDFFSLEFLTALLLIIGIDLILAGDNAIVIALAAARLQDHQRKRAIVYGTLGALAIRIVATLAVVWLLKVPGLHLIGGVLLVWIAYSLLRDHKESKKIVATTSLGAAIRTIIMADALMGLDNVLAIGGAASGNYVLVVIGLLISIPLVMGGSALFLKLVDRYAWITYAGSGILAFTSGKMIFADHIVYDAIAGVSWIKWPIIILIVISVIFFGWRSQQGHKQSAKAVPVEESI